MTGINKYLEIKLPSDNNSRRIAYNCITLLAKNNSKGEVKKGREWLSDDTWENASSFVTWVVKDKVEKGYHPQSWWKVKNLLDLWLVNQGVFKD